MEANKKIKRSEYIGKSANILLLTYTVLFLLYHTVAGLYAQDLIERLECVVGLLMAVVMVMKLIDIDWEARIRWLKSSYLVIIYFIIRTVSFVNSGFDYSVARTVFFEGVYLFVICGMITDSKFCKKVIMKSFVVINFVLNVINVIVYFVLRSGNASSGLYKLFSEYTYAVKNSVIYSGMYDNPNAFGVMTAIAIILALNLISKNDTKQRKLIIAVYVLFSLYCVNLSECRSAMLSLFACAVSWALVTVTKGKITGRMLAIAAFVVALAVTGGIYGFMKNNTDTGLYQFSADEVAIENASTGRYSIWKAGYYAHQDNKLLGAGSIKNEMADRNAFVYQNLIDIQYGVSSYVEDDRGPHNGYLAMIYCTGLLGFLAFMAALLKKMLEAKSLRYGGWYLAIIFFMSVNMFETMTIVSRFFVCLLIFIILAMDNNDEEHGYGLEYPDEAKLL